MEYIAGLRQRVRDQICFLFSRLVGCRGFPGPGHYDGSFAATGALKFLMDGPARQLSRLLRGPL